MSINLTQFRKLHLMVCGDIMLDQYWFGDTSRISPEAPVPVVNLKNKKAQPGGAGNVARNLRALEVTVSLFAQCGDDKAGQELLELLTACGIITEVQQDAQRETISKLRILSLHQQLLRLDHEPAQALALNTHLEKKIAAQLPISDAIILSDYGKGLIPQIAQSCITVANKRNIPILVDPKGTNFDIYRKANVITPNMNEFEAVVGPCSENESLFVERAMNLLSHYAFEHLLITRGAKGMSLISKDKAPLHLPATAKEVYDVTGAGDTVISVFAACLAAKMTATEAMTLANHAAGLVVSKLGAATISLSELTAFDSPQPTTPTYLSLTALKEHCTDQQKKGKKIVFTNGCFDILHAGHVKYLAEAKALGDYLIVGINTDASIKRLKGKTRPINTLKNRMDVLSHLKMVDWVIPFEEDTPLHLIETLKPDILVKAGDWTIETMVGADLVQSNGGIAKILSFKAGLSTSAIINKIREEKA